MVRQLGHLRLARQSVREEFAGTPTLLTFDFRSYGFYLMQFITIYAFMPHLVIAFNAEGRSYWDIIGSTSSHLTADCGSHRFKSQYPPILSA